MIEDLVTLMGLTPEKAAEVRATGREKMAAFKKGNETYRIGEPFLKEGSFRKMVIIYHLDPDGTVVREEEVDWLNALGNAMHPSESPDDALYSLLDVENGEDDPLNYMVVTHQKRF